MRKRSWASLEPGFSRYDNVQDVRAFVQRARRELHPLALILFGSLARGDYHEHSDADVCLVLPSPPLTPFEGYDRAVACDPSGVVQPVVYGREQFLGMVEDANALALEVMADGLFLAGVDQFRCELERVFRQTRQRLGIQRSPTGWRLAHPQGRVL